MAKDAPKTSWQKYYYNLPAAQKVPGTLGTPLPWISESEFLDSMDKSAGKVQFTARDELNVWGRSAAYHTGFGAYKVAGGIIDIAVGAIGTVGAVLLSPFSTTIRENIKEPVKYTLDGASRGVLAGFKEMGQGMASLVTIPAVAVKRKVFGQDHDLSKTILCEEKQITPPVLIPYSEVMKNMPKGPYNPSNTVTGEPEKAYTKTVMEAKKTNPRINNTKNEITL